MSERDTPIVTKLRALYADSDQHTLVEMLAALELPDENYDFRYALWVLKSDLTLKLISPGVYGTQSSWNQDVE